VEIGLQIKDYLIIYKELHDTYFERFDEMAKLENDMVVYTSPEFEDRVKDLRGDKPTQIVIVDFKNEFGELKEKVSNVQKDPEFQKKINPSQVRNPEYWNSDYVVVNLLNHILSIVQLRRMWLIPI
jgi:hypothetical protein